jgi:hypothetical protein
VAKATAWISALKGHDIIAGGNAPEDKMAKSISTLLAARDALRLFEQRDKIRELQIKGLRKKINEGWASLEQGEGLDGEEFFRGLEREERELRRKRKQA